MAGGQPGTPFRPRSALPGHLTVDSGGGAVLIEPRIVSELRAAAAQAGHRPAGGLLYGRAYHDTEGEYTVVDACVQAGSAADLSRQETIAELRADAAGRFPDATQVGWWRSAPRPIGAQAAQDPGTWPMSQRPDGVGLVVYADGALWEAFGAPSGVRGRSAAADLRTLTDSAAARSDTGGATDSDTDSDTGGGADTAADGARDGATEPATLAGATVETAAGARAQTAAGAIAEAAGSAPGPRPLLISPLRTAGPPAMSPDPGQMWRPKAGWRRPPEHHEPWWREAHRIVAVLIVVLAIVIAIAVLVILSPLF